MNTMNLRISGIPEAQKKTLQRVDLLVINDSEARELAEEPNLIRAAGMIRKMGPESLIIKKGEHGALLFTGDEIFYAHAFTIVVIFEPLGALVSFICCFFGVHIYSVVCNRTILGN